MNKKGVFLLAMLITVASVFVSGSALALELNSCHALGVATADSVALLEPCSVPTLNEWGMIIFMVLAGLGSVFYIRRNYRKI